MIFITWNTLNKLPSVFTTPGNAVGELRWFEIDELPPAEEFAHHGWGRTVLVKHALGKARPLTTSSPK